MLAHLQIGMRRNHPAGTGTCKPLSRVLGTRENRVPGLPLSRTDSRAGPDKRATHHGVLVTQPPRHTHAHTRAHTHTSRCNHRPSEPGTRRAPPGVQGHRGAECS